MSPSSRGLGHHPFTVSTGVRIPLGTPSSNKKTRYAGFFVSKLVVQRCIRISPMSSAIEKYVNQSSAEAKEISENDAVLWICVST